MQNLFTVYDEARARADRGFARRSQSTYERTRREIFSLIHAEGLQNRLGLANELIKGGDMNGTLDIADIQKLQAYAKELLDPNSEKAGIVDAIGRYNFNDDVKYRLISHLSNPADEDRGNVVNTQRFATAVNREMENIQRDIDNIIQTSTDRTDALLKMREYEGQLRTRLLAEYPSFGTEKLESTTAEGQAAEAEIAETARTQYQEFSFFDAKQFALGGVGPDRATSGLRKISRKLVTDTLRAPESRSVGLLSGPPVYHRAKTILQGLDKALEEAGDDYSYLEKQTAFVQAVGYGGLMTVDGLEALASGDSGAAVENVKERLLGFTSYGKVFDGDDADPSIKQRTELADKNLLVDVEKTVKPLSDYLQNVAMEDLNPYLLRVPGFEDVSRYIIRDTSGTDNVPIVPLDSLPEDLRDQTVRLLNLFEIPVTGRNVANFYKAQSDNWKR
jgi:hypothetical protein